MRIALIYDREEGGLPVSTAVLAVSLARLRHDVLLCGPKAFLPKQLALDISGNENIAAFELAARGKISFPVTLRKRVAAFAPDTIVTSHRGCDIRGGRLAGKLGIPQICVVGGDPSAGDMQNPNIPFLRLRNRAWARTLSSAAGVVAVSEWVRRKTLETFPGLRPAEIDVVFNAIDQAFFDGDSLSRREGLRDPVRLLAVGRLYHLKKPLLLPELVSGLEASGLQVRARWVGRGEMAQSLKAKARGCGVADAVEIAQDSPDITEQYQWADIFVHFCMDEGFGLVLAEAQAAGLPVIAFNAGAVPEVVANGKTGFLVEACDIRAMSRMITRLASEEKLYLTMSGAAGKRAAELFTLERHGARYERVLQKAVSTAEKGKK